MDGQHCIVWDAEHVSSRAIPYNRVHILHISSVQVHFQITADVSCLFQSVIAAAALEASHAWVLTLCQMMMAGLQGHGSPAIDASTRCAVCGTWARRLVDHVFDCPHLIHRICGPLVACEKCLASCLQMLDAAELVWKEPCNLLAG